MPWHDERNAVILDGLECHDRTDAAMDGKITDTVHGENNIPVRTVVVKASKLSEMKTRIGRERTKNEKSTQKATTSKMKPRMRLKREHDTVDTVDTVVA